MEDLKARALEQAIKTLDNLKCKYLIITEDGTSYGEIVVEPKKRTIFYKKGEVRQYVKDFCNNKYPDAGHQGEIPCGPFPVEAVRSTLLNWAMQESGSGSMTTTLSEDKQRVIFYRAF